MVIPATLEQCCGTTARGTRDSARVENNRDGGDGIDKEVTVESIATRGSSVEIKVTDDDTGETSVPGID